MVDARTSVPRWDTLECELRKLVLTGARSIPNYFPRGQGEMNTERRVQRTGFTAFELIIVVIIIVILILLLLPAVQAAREAARRAQCINNAKQLMLATVNYESATARMPVANDAPPIDGKESSLGRVAPGHRSSETFYVDGVAKPDNDGYSWIVAILPYLDAAPTYDLIFEQSNQFAIVPFDKALGNAEDHPAVVQLSTLQCPSYSGPMQTVKPQLYNGIPVATTNYLAMAGATRGVRAAGVVDDHDTRLGGTIISARAEPAGVARRSGVRIREVSDGTSRTIALCETIQKQTSSWLSGQSAWTIALDPDRKPKLADAENGHAVADDTPHNVNRGTDDGDAADDEAWYATSLKGGKRDWGPSSNHAGGVVVHSRGDGSVFVVSEDIDATVYFAMSTRAGGERVVDE